MVPLSRDSWGSCVKATVHWIKHYSTHQYWLAFNVRISCTFAKHSTLKAYRVLGGGKASWILNLDGTEWSSRNTARMASHLTSVVHKQLTAVYCLVFKKSVATKFTLWNLTQNVKFHSVNLKLNKKQFLCVKLSQQKMFKVKKRFYEVPNTDSFLHP
jgi:hypothetical protein